MEFATRLFLVRRVSASAVVPETQSTWMRSLDRLASRKPTAVVGPRDESELEECARRMGCESRVAPGLDPAGEGATSRATRLFDTLGELAREFRGAEIVVLLEAGAIQLALSRALLAPDAGVFAPEPGQTIALDWPHPEARDFEHGLVGIGFDWDVGPVAKQVLRFPGGASVLPRS